MTVLKTHGAGPSEEEIVIADPKMLELMEAARSIALHKAAVLITGETGSGKEVVARTIHEHSERCQRPWVDLNCAALPEHLVESELFGYEKGAFSGANSAKPGLFELANGGTLFLDEIGDLDPKFQVKLLRVLDGAPYYRLGGSRKVSVDVRVLAATNRDLQSSVQDGSFRGDLYHRISELHLRVPPLRERPEDITALAQHFLHSRRPEAVFSSEALQLLRRLPWYGNVRELRNLVLKLAVLSPHPEITAQDVRRYTGEPEPGRGRAPEAAFPQLTSIAEMERQMIVRALELAHGNQSLAAEHLEMPRRTFCRKLNQFHITVERRHHSAKAVPEPPPNQRKELNVPVSLITRDGQCFEVTSRNLSAGGMGVHNVQQALPLNEELTVAFSLPESDEQVSLRGVVVWTEENGTAGIRFVNVSDAKLAVLRCWLGGQRGPAPATPPAPVRLAPAHV